MKDAIGNILMVGDIVMVALGANHNTNNSSLTPCEIIEIRGNRCKIKTANNVVTEHKKHDCFSWATKELVWDDNGNLTVRWHRTCWKFPRQVVKVEKFLHKIEK